MCPCRKEKHDADEAVRKRNDEMRRVRDLKAASFMDRKLGSATFENYDLTKYNDRQYKICKRYSEKFPEMLRRNQGLLLCGGVGTGKTYAAACIANDLMNRSVSVVMISFVRILRGVHGFKEENRDDRFMNRLMSTKLLIIDDLGAERGTDYAVENVYSVIDSRYRSGKPMILTTNLTPTEMQEATDIRYSRIYDRLFEVCYPIEFKGPSWRKREASVRRREMQKLFEEE
jgi:DNA replication protein DnaC